MLATEQSSVEFDLGRPTPLRAAYLQGDNNDAYIVSVSDDGQSFRELWTALPVASAGLRERWTDTLEGQGRFVRISARGGDGYSRSPSCSSGASGRRRTRRASRASWPRARRPTCGPRCSISCSRSHLPWGTRTGTSVKLAVLFGGLPLAAAGLAALAFGDGWPPAGREVALVRAVAAGARPHGARAPGGPGPALSGPPRRHQGDLRVAALLAVASFYNLGRPQFWNHAARGPEFVHLPDMRIYQPFAKYFDELRYDGVYVASVLAYAEDERGGSLESLADVPVRDLRTQRSVHARDPTTHVREVRQRFSDARWDAFKHDLAYFRGAMGPDFLTTLTDHGANATPVWVWFARLVLGHVPASETTLVAGGLIDAVLLLIMAVAIARTSGLLPMLVAMTVFGANDLYMFGTDWGGATLRHDWLAALGLAACALARRRWTAAGILIGLATMIRAFPIIALVGVGAPRDRRIRRAGVPAAAAARLAQAAARERRRGAHDCRRARDHARRAAGHGRPLFVRDVERMVVEGRPPQPRHRHQRAQPAWAGRRHRRADERALAGPPPGLSGARRRDDPRRRPGRSPPPAARGDAAGAAAGAGVLDPSNYHLHLVFLLVLVTVPGGL